MKHRVSPHLRLAGLARREAIARLRAEADTLSLAERFTILHQLGIYAGDESASGAASSLAETQALRDALPALLESHGVKRMLDIPCGDFHWMRHVPLGDVVYLGADIVAPIVARNLERYGSDNRTFHVLDITRDPLPTVDLVLCRDLFIHLSLEDIDLALGNLVRSGSRLLLTSHFTDREENTGIWSGEFRPVNLCRPPFNLPAPITVIRENSRLADCAFEDRAMALWRLRELHPAGR